MIGRMRGWLRSLGQRRPAPLILMYHRIAAVAADPWNLAIDPQAFETQMGHLARYRLVVSLGEFVELHRRGQLPSRAAALTFDDGCVCNATAAAPVLRRYGLQATFFLATGMIGSAEEFWWDHLERIIFDPAAGGRATLRLGSQDLQVDLGQGADNPQVQRAWRALDTATFTQRQASYIAVWSALKHHPAGAQGAALIDLARQVGSRLGARATHLPMSAEQARSLAATEGFEIGGHTVDHVSLPGMDAVEQLRQMRGSRQACEDLAARRCDIFAYPYGDVSPQTCQLAIEAGFAGAVTTRHAAVAPTDDLLALPRITVTSQSVFGRHLCP
jgi:peptidoglycan/xylan/chitin deacetylase (PgdA/CDA1 family)